MLSKRSFFISLSILALILILVGADIFLDFNHAKKDATKIVDDYLVTHRLTENIQTKETVYSSKTAEYYIKVVFKDEPQNLYEFFIYKDKVDNIMAFDERNVGITDKINAKYLNE